MEYIDPSDLDKGDYELLMNYLKYKLIGKDVYAKDNYAYFDLNGAINSVSINDMIQKEIWGMITGQFYFPGGGDTPGGSGGEDSTGDDVWSEDSTGDDVGSEDSTVDDIGSVDYTVNDVRVVSSGVALQNIQNLRDLRKFSN
jgi:hypothetical protein